MTHDCEWVVADMLNLGPANIARPVHDGGFPTRGEAQRVADMLNEEEGDPRYDKDTSEQAT